MSKKTYAYKTVKTIEDFKKDLLEYPQYAEESFLTKNTLPIAIQCLDEMNEEAQERFLSCLHHIDKRLGNPGSAKADRFHKVPIILSSAIYFAYFNDAIKDYTNDEIMLLSEYSFPEHLEFYQTATKSWTKELLGTINSLDNDPLELMDYMILAGQSLEQQCTPTEITEYLKATPPRAIKEGVQAFVEMPFERKEYRK